MKKVLDSWSPLLGQRVIQCDDSDRVAEVIVSAIQVAEGADKAAVAGSWPASTATTVANAIKSLLPARVAPVGRGVARFG